MTKKNEKIDKAFELYKKGYKLIDISKELDIPECTVRTWKSRYKWETFHNKEEKKFQNLTEKQRLFCIYYIENFNATRAYQKAYNCNYDTARTEGSKNLSKPNIKAEIERLTKECLEELEINSKLMNRKILQKYIDIAFSDLGDYLTFHIKKEPCWSKNKDGELIPKIDPNTGKQKVIEYNEVKLKDSRELDTSIISEISEGKDGIKIKLADKMKALEFLVKHYYLLGNTEKERLELEGRKLQIEKLKQDISKADDNEKDGILLDMLKGITEGLKNV